MIYLTRSKRYFICGVYLVLAILVSCGQRLPEISPKLITEKTPHDTDDPAIWINPEDAAKSIVFGTDKDEVNGGVYAFDLQGKIIEEKSITGVSYPNNVDIAYGFKLNDSISVDVMLFTEREKNQIRMFSVPDVQPLDNGGFPVFEDDTDLQNRRPMGIALYKDDHTSELYAIVSRKIGPKQNYLYQYKIVSDSIGVHAEQVRKFGAFSGVKEIEAIVVDNELGFVYYSDEMNCIRKYYANPAKGDDELSCFGGEHFKEDIEGIAIAKTGNDSGFLIVSNQQANSFNIFDRSSNKFIKEINLGTTETDGCDVTTLPLGDVFPNGLFVSMNDARDFYFHDLGSLNLKD